MTSNIIQQNEEKGEYTDTLLSNHHDKFPYMQQLDREETEPGAVGTCSMRIVVSGVDTQAFPLFSLYALMEGGGLVHFIT